MKNSQNGFIKDAKEHFPPKSNAKSFGKKFKNVT